MNVSRKQLFRNRSERQYGLARSCVREGITVTTRAGDNAQAHMFVRCVPVVTEPAIRDNSVSPVASPAICESAAAESFSTEGATVDNVVSRDTERTRSITTSGFPSPSIVPSLTTNDMVVTRSRTNELQHEGASENIKIPYKKQQLHVKLLWMLRRRSQIHVVYCKDTEQ